MHRLHAEIGRQQREEVLFGDEAEVEEQPLEALAALDLETLHLAEIVRGDAALLEQELLERPVLELHRRKKHTRAPVDRQANSQGKWHRTCRPLRPTRQRLSCSRPPGEPS